MQARLVASARIASIAVAAAAWSTSEAGIIASYGGPNSFSAKISRMPDLDQFRATLLPDGNGNGGGMYCVPTSTMNLFAYAANNGFPEIFPGPGDWQVQSSYPVATLGIAVTAALMGTDPVNGTTGNGAFGGASAVVATSAKDKLCVQRIMSSGPQQWVRVHDIAKQVALGGIPTLAYGRYSVTGLSAGTYVLAVDDDGNPDRNGGHAVTFESAAPSGPFADYALTVRDPATPDVPDSMQSAFGSNYTDVYSLTLRAGDGGQPFTADTVYWKVSKEPGTIRLIDSAQVLRPCGALRFTNLPTGILLSLLSPSTLGLVPASVTIAAPAAGLADLAFSADASDAYALVVTSPATGATQLRRINLANGAQQPFGGIPGLRGIAVGRDGRVYAHDGTAIHAFGLDGTHAASFTPPGAPSAIAYDDLRDRVVVLSVPRRSVTALGKSLAPIAEAVVPAAIPMSGNGSIAVSPEDGSAYFVTSASDSLGRVGPGMTAAEVSLSVIAGISAPQRIACGDGGRLWITSQGAVRAVGKDDAGRWVQDPSSPFHLLADQGPIAIMRSRTNFDPALHTGPGWRDIASAEDAGLGLPIADCVADLNDDGQVNGADLGVLLSNWGQTRLEAVTISFDYSGNAAGSWASDLVLVVDDGAHPSIGWGGYDSVLGAAVDAGNWPFHGSGSVASGRYVATVPLPTGAALSGAGPWSVTVGNGWTTSPAVQYRNVRVEPAGAGMPSLVTVDDQAASGLESVTRPFAIAGLPGDLNADGQVDGADLGSMLSAWGACMP